MSIHSPSLKSALSRAAKSSAEARHYRGKAEEACRRLKHAENEADDLRKKLLAAEVAELAFEWELNDFAKKACDTVLSDEWDGKNSI